MVRLPKNFSNSLRFETGAVKTGASALEAELMGEKALALGLAAKSMETALDVLNTCSPDDTKRPALIQRAADSVYAYFIQRELMGFIDHKQAIEDYDIPKIVLSRVGAK